MAIKITSDRMIDLSFDELDKLNIATIPCYINMDGKSYNDLDDIFPEDIFAYVERTKKMAMTAAKPPEAYAEFFEPFIKNGDTIIHFATSSGISAICSYSKVAAETFKNKVFVVDTLKLSNGIAILAKYAIDLIKKGEKNAKKIADMCTALIPKIACSFFLNDLEFLYRGGRCSGFAYYGANLLKIKPVIAMDETGHMTVREKIKGKYEPAIKTYIQRNLEKYPPRKEAQDLYVPYSVKDDETKEYILKVIAEFGYKFNNIYFNKCGCNCAVHCGRNAIGMFYIME